MTDLQNKVKYNSSGLVPVVAQDDRTDEVLMLAYMNKESLDKTLETGYAHYYSRSRQKLWLKGETSGHYQKVKSIRIDCDGDTLLIKVIQTGVACHLGHYSCFFSGSDITDGSGGTSGPDRENRLGMTQPGVSGQATVEGHQPAKVVNPVTTHATEEGIPQSEETATQHPEMESEQSQCLPASKELSISKVTGESGEPDEPDEPDEPEECHDAGILRELFDVISDRLANPREGSYTNYLFNKGTDKILKKIGEESSEVIIAAKNDIKDDLKAEIADLFYHVLVLLVNQGLTMEDIYRELRKRR